jgi:serine/threonine protein phosphatase PrpC
MRPLHEAGFVWLNFHPDHLERGATGAHVTNLDVRLFRGGEHTEGVPLAGLYSPPEVCESCPEQIGPASDVFHLSAYAYYRLAGLLPYGFPGQGPEAFDFDFPPLRVYRPGLPVGIAPVLERGLAGDPAQRYPSIDAFLQALDEAITRAHLRQASATPLAFEVGGRTVTGRAKAALGRANQDAFVLARSTGGPFVIVADGVTHARIGSGDLASQTTCAVLGNLVGCVPAVATEDEMHDLLRAGCLEASRAVLQRALALGPVPPGTSTSDLMSSTALIGAVHGGTLSLANVGDSRAYLLTARGAEQLTVDGDVSCVELALGAAPEEVRALGAEGQALYYCVGVCEPAPFGGMRCSIERSAPQVTHWQLLPGDVVVFCTDGLVEAGAFLTPAEVAGCVRANPGDSAEGLAERLVALADDRQRLPSPEEPDGFGDNITCVVMKVLAAGGEEVPPVT